MKVTREDLIKRIKQCDLFYEHTSFVAHDYEDLLRIYKAVEESKSKKEGEKTWTFLFF